jgi:succinate dehydrogenase flavoprotein subunit
LAREYGGLLDNRSFGGAQVSRTFYARGQTGQQLLLGAYQAVSRQIEAGAVRLVNRTELLDVVTVEGRAAGIIARDLLTGDVSAYPAHAVVLATGGYSNVFFLSTNAKQSNATAIWRAHRRGALFANRCFTQIHPTCIPRPLAVALRTLRLRNRQADYATAAATSGGCGRGAVRGGAKSRELGSPATEEPRQSRT